MRTDPWREGWLFSPVQDLAFGQEMAGKAPPASPLAQNPHSTDEETGVASCYLGLTAAGTC